MVAAVRRLEAVLDDLTMSDVYETAPVGIEAQPRFLNACVTGITLLPPRELLRALHGVEQKGGRVRQGPRFGPRTIDLDLLLYGDVIIDSADLTVPHPRMLDRAFVLVPLADVAGDWRVPGSSDSVRALATRVDAVGVRRLGTLDDLLRTRETG
jgi:2-amino-4-hydroxy-6-hydroxymethyldihydropteridine diphosphokinase